MSRLTTLDSLKHSKPSWDFSSYMSQEFKIHSHKQNYTILWNAGYSYHQGKTPCLGSQQH